MNKCWDDKRGVFWDLSGAREERVAVLTFTSLFPLVLRDLDQDVAIRLVEEHLLDPNEFWLPYPIPSIAATEPAFDPGWLTKTTWRGPTWVNVNWYMYWALRDHGFPEQASELARRTVAMQAHGGIREFYDPRTAEGQGATQFGWSCLVLDLIAAEQGSGEMAKRDSNKKSGKTTATQATGSGVIGKPPGQAVDSETGAAKSKKGRR